MKRNERSAMHWNEKHVNDVKYPDNPELEQALGHLRECLTWYEQQQKYRKRGIDTTPVQTAWDRFLRLRKQHEQEG